MRGGDCELKGCGRETGCEEKAKGRPKVTRPLEGEKEARGGGRGE